MHYYQFNIGDYTSHTHHLSPIEDLAYRRLLDKAYSTELPLIKDIHQLARSINLRDYEQEVKDVLQEFFLETEEGWINNRVCKEIEKTGIKSDKAKNAAAIRWENERKANAIQLQSERNAAALSNNADAYKIDATHNPIPNTHNPIPNTHKPKKHKSAKTYISDDFGISESIKKWAENNGYKQLEKHLAHFINVSKANGYQYLDWDAAFRNAISGDWAKLGNSQQKTSTTKDFLNNL